MEFLPVLDVFPPERQRRWTVLLRLLLLIPQFFTLWVLGVVAALAVILGWFAALVLGRLPVFAAGYLTSYLGYAVRVGGYAMLLVDRYPPFALDAPDYPVRAEFQPGPLNRWAVFFRVILVIPAAIVQAVVYGGWAVCAFFFWVIVLVLGRTPVPIFQASASVLRYGLRVQAYLYMVSSAYPKRLLGDRPNRDYDPAWGAASATRPLVLVSAAQWLLVLFIFFGVAGEVISSGGDWSDNGTTMYGARPASVSTPASVPPSPLVSVRTP
ncbi:DUF4389 domain-containing protein [Actinospica durhamensis]|uniref:DUF4389 domain-containing protein n=1 Tax=Actinospica durhamensis TaxID=1508375 RepID=A0A941EVJ2_9ACTN|nr:DUF4389 domain-containing protein [Actinospica durhamensis]MBR7837726.1 DUF4389 domain-containing protein [Actinospica durhamensis]